MDRNFVFLFLFLAILHKSCTIASPYGNGLEGELQCHPPPDENTVHYIVGYGSLIETASKDRTQNNTGDSIPVVVSGYRREWNSKGDVIGLDTTYLGVLPEAGCSFNGVIFQLPVEAMGALEGFDTRERFYCRKQVDLSQIRTLSSIPDHINRPAGQYWIYVNRPEYVAYPTKHYPMVESYVDIFLSGCIEVQDRFGLTDFAAACVDSTRGWSRDSWVNDRLYPRRPFIFQPKASRIDALLSERVPMEFANIRSDYFGPLFK